MSDSARDGLTALRLRQGHTWVSRLAELDGWTPERQCEADRELDACPASELDRVVEGYRSAMWIAMERAGNVPHFTRTLPGVQSAPPPAVKRKVRGLARHLYRATASVPSVSAAEPAKHDARARDSPCVAADLADDGDPFRIACCESCLHWRRHPENGAGLCMVEPSTVDVMAARRAWLAAGNALCRCDDFFRRGMAS